MSRARLRTAVIGFGKIARGYARDAAMARYYRYATHAQVLAEHPQFEWVAVVDPSREARDSARTDWSVAQVGSDVAALGSAAAEIDVAVLATPPADRLAILDQLPNLRAVLVEKPLGLTLEDARRFLDACARRRLPVQVNLWRRADEGFRALADGQLHDLVGQPQAIVGYYGNGLKNNGIHLVDFVRMLFGEIDTVGCLGARAGIATGPIADDSSPAFALTLSGGLPVSMLPLDFRHFREVGLDVWGECGRLSVLNEGLTIVHYPSRENRGMTGEREVVADAPRYLGSTVGDALFRMYDNLAAAISGGEPLWSGGDSALRTATVIEAVEVAVRERRDVDVREQRGHAD
jgi:predicted dehydrogenase